MQVLFLTLVEINSLEERGIYQDLLRKFRDKGHSVTIVTSVERRKGIATNLQNKGNVNILQVKTFNIQKTNIVEKGIGTLAIEYQFLAAIKKYLVGIKFDLVLYSTPPITFAKVIDFIRKRDKAFSYLLLKDIFPQNAVDMGMIKEGSFIHRQFLKKEKKLYAVSDVIGCMSKANVEFILKHNPELVQKKIVVNPNSINPVSFNYTTEEKKSIREKYSVPSEKVVFVYGGNLGKPQGLDFLLETIALNKDPDAYFLIIGDGTEYPRIKSWFEEKFPSNAKLLQRLPKTDYDRLLAACDVGLIFLDRNFLIPNFPSRLLSYLEMEMPVISATDPNTDVGDVIQQAGCGFKVISGDSMSMQNCITTILDENLRKKMSKNAKNLLYNHYTVENSYNLIISDIEDV
ncbi:glycosyltransferase family 4 protein [Sphingobacterium spiritivorum]|uniref:glycosyltransferase family 4 protein n=1 Tax=Sphingobacterium spiritivorum TaxID=258 RepID=UPI003DA34F15